MTLPEKYVAICRTCGIVSDPCSERCAESLADIHLAANTGHLSTYARSEGTKNPLAYHLDKGENSR